MALVGLLQAGKEPDPEDERVHAEEETATDGRQLVCDDLFQGGRELGREPDAAVVRVVLLVDVFVQRLGMEDPVRPVEEEVIDEVSLS